MANAMFNNPWTLLGAGMMQGADPRGEALGGLGYGVLNAASIMRQQAQLAEENERARRMADLQAQLYEKRLQPQGADLSKTPTYIRNPETGQYQMIQLSSQGVPQPVVLPEGFEPVRPVTMQDVGGQILGFQQGALQPSVMMPKTLPPEAQPTTRAAQTMAVEEARATQAAREQLPQEESQFQRINRYIDEIIEHPGLESGTGISSFLPVIPGTDRADFEARKKQLIGSVFLQGFQMLKGGGTVTEVEGLKAEQSMARMEAATSKEDFVEALEDYREALRSGLAKLRRRAGAQTPPPPPGFVMD